MTDTCTRISSREPFHLPLELSLIFNSCTRLTPTCYHLDPRNSLDCSHAILQLTPAFSIVIRDLFSNQLNGTIPSTIGLLTNLQYLYANKIATSCTLSHQATYPIWRWLKKSVAVESTLGNHSIDHWIAHQSSSSVRDSKSRYPLFSFMAH